MTEPISIQWPSKDTLRFGKRADAGSEAVNITKGTDSMLLNVWNTYECISIAGSNSGASHISMYGADESGIQLEATAAHTSKLSMYGNSIDSVLALNANSDSTASIDLRSGSSDCIAIHTAANATSSIKLAYSNDDCIFMQTTTDSTGEFVIYGVSEQCVYMQSDSNQTGHIALLQGGEPQLEIDTNADKTSNIRMYYDSAENILAETRTDSTSIITMKSDSADCIYIESLPEGLAKITMLNDGSEGIRLESLTNQQSRITMFNDGDDCIYIESLAERQSKITLLNDTNERIYIGTERDNNDVEHNYIEVEHERSGYYTALDERGLLLPTKFADSSSTEPGEENETRIQAFDSDFLSYANNNQEKIEYLKQTIPSSYAVSSAIKAIQPFSVYPFEFIVTDVDSEGNAEFKIRYYYQDGSNKYRDFTFNYADKQGSASAEFDAAPVTLTGIDKYVARVNSLIAGGSGSAIIADETFDSQRTLAWSYSSSVPVDIEFNNCTFTNDSMVSLFAAVAGQSSPSNLTVKFTNCNCNAIIDMHSMFANLIDTTRLSIDGLEMSNALKDIRRLFVYLGARTDGCDLVIDECNFGDAKGEYTVSGTTIDGVIDIYSWSKIRNINLEDIGLTNQTSNIGDGGGSASHRIGRFEPNCDESAIVPYYIPLTRVDVYGRAVHGVDEVTEIGLILNQPMNFNARDVETGTGRNKLHFTGLAMGIHDAIERNTIVAVPFYSVNELTIDDAWDNPPYNAGEVSITLNFNYPRNVSGVTVSPKIDRFGFTLDKDEAKSAITHLNIHNGDTLVEQFDNIQYNDDDTITVTVDEEEKEFSEWFNSQNYAFNLNNGDVYFELTNPSYAISDSFEFSSILSTKK